jgi:hypothetical protein
MNDVIDRILSTYQLMRPLDPDRVSDSRQRITRYIESLASAGQSDPQQLAVYGLAYLKELHEKRDPNARMSTSTEDQSNGPCIYALARIAFGGAPLAVVPGKKSFDSRGSRAIDQLSWELPGRHRVQ